MPRQLLLWLNLVTGISSPAWPFLNIFCINDAKDFCARVAVLQRNVPTMRQSCRPTLWCSFSAVAVCRALGDADYKEPKAFVSSEASVRRLDLLPEDKAVIVASDGLWDVIGDQDVVTMVDQHIKVTTIACPP